MKAQHLHIVSLSIPHPDNYGGMIDIFNKIKALHKLGIKIHLHCFQYDREKSKELEKYCEKVKYYKRKVHWKKWFSLLPFIVNTRRNEFLLKEISKDQYPILFEGLHTTFLLGHKQLKDRIKFVRTHNVEKHYYYSFFKSENNWLKKFYFFSEYLKISLFEDKLNKAKGILAISSTDKEYFNKLAPTIQIHAFHQHDDLNCKVGMGDYALYHGNLSVIENENAAFFFVKKVFNQIEYPLLITGKDPSEKLKKEIKKHKNIKLIANPNESELNSIIKNAHLNLLTTAQGTGVKIKLLKSLFLGRHCIVNNTMLNGTNLSSFCQIANQAEEWVVSVNKWKDIEFDNAESIKREKILSLQNNEVEAKKIIDFIWP